MPGKREKFEIIPGVAGLNITGLYLPAPQPQDGFDLVLIAIMLSAFLVFGSALLRSQTSRKTGEILPVFWLGVGIMAVIPGLVFLSLGSPLFWEMPEFKETGSMLRRGYQPGLGMLVVPEMLAVWLALLSLHRSFYC